MLPLINHIYGIEFADYFLSKFREGGENFSILVMFKTKYGR